MVLHHTITKLLGRSHVSGPSREDRLLVENVIKRLEKCGALDPDIIQRTFPDVKVELVLQQEMSEVLFVRHPEDDHLIGSIINRNTVSYFNPIAS